MDDAAIVAAWASVIATVIGPLVGIGIANSFARRESLRQESSKLFRQIMEDAQNYRHAFLDMYGSRFNFKSAMAAAEKWSGIVTADASLAAGIESQLKESKADLQRVEDRLATAFRDVRAIESLLNADVLSLGLLFDEKCEPCGRAIRDLIAMSQLFNQQELRPLEDCDNRLAELIQCIAESLKPLHRSIRRTDPME